MASKIWSTYEKLVATINEARDDAVKADQGVHAAGTRLRQAMMTVKAEAQAIREQVIAERTEKSGS